MDILRRFVSRRRYWPVEIAAWLGLVLFLLFAVRTLTRAPCLGIADNGDFWRVMQPAGIEHVEPLARPGRFVRCSFSTGEASLGRGFSSSSLLAWVAKHVGWGLPSAPGTMDLRQMGLLYLVLGVLLLALGLASRVSPLLAVAVVYVLVDPGYLLFFNSFYADSALFVSLVAITLWLNRWGELSEVLDRTSSSRWAGIACLLLALLAVGGTSKALYILLPAVVGGVLVAALAIDRPGRRRRTAVLLGAVATLAVIIPGHFLRGSGLLLLEANNYHAVYGGILVVSGDPDRVFNALDVPEEFRGLPRSDIYSAHIPLDHPVHGHLRDLSRPMLAWLYFTEPGALVKVAARIQRELASVETHRRGNRSRDEAQRRKSVFRTPWQYSNLRAIVFGAWPPVSWLVLGWGFTWMVVCFGRRRSVSWPAILFLSLWITSQFVVVVLGDGLVSLKQHLVGARLGLDLLLVLLLFDLCSALVRKYRHADIDGDQPIQGTPESR